MRSFFLTILSLLWAQGTLFATENFTQKALELHLQDTKYWHKLLHFENNQSSIVTPSFFFANDGKTNAKNELIATIQNFEKNSENICYFPARYDFLHKHLKLTLHAQCPQLDEYIQENYKEISLIFTAPKYNAPASIFGHTFLKIYSDTIPYAVNYAAHIPDVSTFNYVYGGLSGKFYSHYKLLAYNSKAYEYKEEEYRDLVEYKLKLSKEQIKHIMLHLYEIKETQEYYYFLSKNCSSEILKLLDFRDESSHLSQELHSVTIPINIVTILQNNHLLKNIAIHYSKMKNFYRLVNQLTRKERALLEKIISFQATVRELKHTPMTQKEKAKIVQAAISYFEMHKEKKEFQKSLSTLFKLITLKNSLHIQSKEPIKILKKNPISDKFHKIFIAQKYSRKRLQETIIGTRALYKSRFDLLDDIEQKGSIELLELAIRHDTQNNYTLDHFTLINLESIAPSNAFFTNITNKIKIGSKRLFYHDTLYSYANVSLGYSRAVSNTIKLNTHLQSGIYYYNTTLASLGLHTALIYNFHNHYLLNFSGSYDAFTHGVQAKALTLSQTLRVTHATTLDALLSYKKDTKPYQEAQIQLNFYF